MKPIIRKELYLNKIVGNNDYETPEKPIPEEEFFFAEILGEAVQAPEPLTRYQMYLAKIAGREIEIPYPETRLEYFLARAAGMDIETPTPITREEIYWSNYTAIVEFEVEGVPPLTYKAIEGTLENYRIFGNTVGGESVGDRTGNLFNYFDLESGSISPTDGANIESTQLRTKSYMEVNSNTQYYISNLAGDIRIHRYASDYTYLYSEIINGLFTTPNNCVYIRFSGTQSSYTTNVMLNAGSTPLPYEPYGYKVPVTVEGKNLVSSYLVENKRERYANTLWCEIDFKPNTEYILDFIYAAGAQFYTNEYVFETVNYTNVLGGKRSLKLKTKSTIDKNSGNQYVANKGWIILKNNIDATEDIEISDIQIRLASIEDDTYEPYRTPVTTPIYLPEQIRKIGDEAEYIDYTDQKLHRVYADDIDVVLPELPTLAGTNVLTVGTAVQPSKVYVKYKGERQ